MFYDIKTLVVVVYNFCKVTNKILIFRNIVIPLFV